jgi:signal peptidase II
MPRRYRLLLWIGSISIISDQITKYWARGALVNADGRPTPIVVIEGYWDFVLAYNFGSAFSMFENLTYGRFWLSVVAALAIAMIVRMVHKAEENQTGFVVALSLMAGGAVGNLIDRIAFGKVTDFVLWKYGDFRWPVFNIADIALSVAVGLFLVVAVKDWKEQRKAEKEQPKAAKVKPKAAIKKRKSGAKS